MWKELKVFFHPAALCPYSSLSMIAWVLQSLPEPYSCTTLLMNGILYQKKKKDKKKEEGSRDLLRQEFGQHDAGGAHPQWAQKLVNDAVHVVERQGVEDDVIFGPRPL